MTTPLLQLPEDWTDLRICLKVTGGIGDALIAIGGTAWTLKSKDCEITAAVMDHQRDLIGKLKGVDRVVKAQSLNTVGRRANYDVILVFNGVLASGRQIHKGEYYSLVSQYLGHSISPGAFTFSHRFDKKVHTCALHPGASNPNRRWPKDKWRDLAHQLIAYGHHLFWLGTKDEYGFNSNYSTKVSDNTEDLVIQSRVLSGCNYFIGNDSGFAHIAGLLGLPGSVLFFSTHPDNVIARYEALRGVHCFDELGIEPSRSLRVDDLKARQAIRGLSVGKVLESLSLTELDDVGKAESNPMRVHVGVLGVGEKYDNLVKFLDQYYEVTQLEEMPRYHNSYEVLIEVKESKVNVQVEHMRPISVNSNHPENVRRAIRELLGRKI